MKMMTALVKEGRKVSVRQVAQPTLGAPDDVLLRVMAAGICRTDLYAAEGRIPCRDPLILGHEFSALVEDVGPSVRNLEFGDPVSVMPWIPCGECQECRAGEPNECQRQRMLGVDLDGAFAEFIVVPASVIYRLPTTLPFRMGAYMEPVAASLAVLKAGLQPQERGLLYGSNRIALLTGKILSAYGFKNVTIFDPETSSHELGTGKYDFAIETLATTDTLREIVRAVRPRGKIILKSRPCGPVGLDIRAAVLKELTLHAVNYGSFQEAIDLVAGSRLDLDDLLGPLYPLDQFEHVFALSNESAKSFFALAAGAGNQ